MEALIVVPVLFTLVGVVLAGTGFRTLRTARRFRAVAVRSPGVVTDLNYRSVGRNISSGTWFPVLRFEAADGRQIETQAMYGRRPAAARRGDQVTVLYDPEDPTRAALEGKHGGGFVGAVLLVLGILFATLGLTIGGVALLVTDRL